MAANKNTSPAETYTLNDFIEMGKGDEETFHNFASIRQTLYAEFVDQNVLDFYMDELRAISVKVDEFSAKEINKYKYHPDLLAYAVYGSTQLDFIILLANGIIDPKEFNFKRKYIYIPPKNYLDEFLSLIYNKERLLIEYTGNGRIIK